MLSGVVMSTLISIQHNNDWQLLVVSLAMAVGGAFSIYIVRRRTDMTRAALKATALGLFALAATTLATEAVPTQPTLYRFILVALNGAACLFIVPGLLPPLERLFNITTDIQLLEYSDLNNELLSRMAIEVPATYAHSLMLGQLAEAAADAIGANGLLARVCAYYHDIGKLRRPEYFSENQTNGNVHDSLSPRLSARAIAAHVIQGAEMAREAHLPQPIIDGILEHHGTSLISFFYQQAQAQQKHGDIREEDFRYPGPKPQSRETAILMICDAVESGVRSIKNPNEERVREFVDKIVAARSADRQFDESDLTLKDLDVISEVVTKRILSTLHTRIAYPDAEREKKAQAAGNVVSISGAKE
jgi:putative nucleotidyltransferase with HDIG domain